MRLLLDTHVFLWSVLGDRRLTNKTRVLLSDADQVLVGSASILEIAIKQSLDKIRIEGSLADLVESIEVSGFVGLPITAKHAAAAAELPSVHGDPFDRVLIAQAIRTCPAKWVLRHG